MTPLTDEELLFLTKLFFGYIPEVIRRRELRRIAHHILNNKKPNKPFCDKKILEQLYYGAKITHRGCWVKGNSIHHRVLDGITPRGAHVYSLHLMGPKTENGIVCHFCDNKPCVNFLHLFFGTYRDNRMDYLMKHPKQIHPYEKIILPDGRIYIKFIGPF